MERRSRAGQVACVSVVTARRDEVQRTSRVQFDTRQHADVCQTSARKGPVRDCFFAPNARNGGTASWTNADTEFCFSPAPAVR